jgi:Ser/Thr protein kinase RdoA (MazF antagonist)
MDTLIEEALAKYCLGNPEVVFIRHNENQTYKVVDGKCAYVLRIHKHREGLNFDFLGDGLYSKSALNSEVIIVNELREHTNIPLQSHCANKDGDYVSELSDGTLATMLTWLKGTTLENVESMTDDTLFNLGVMLGELHTFSRKRSRSWDLNRQRYDSSILRNIIRCIEKGTVNGSISEKQYRAAESAISEIERRMTELDQIPNSTGIIHSDLTKSNLILHDGKIVPIDFCLCGFGYYYLDFGVLFSQFQDPSHQEKIIQGYHSLTGEKVDRRYIEAFEVYQVMLFLAASADTKPDLSWFPEQFFGNA